METIHTNERKNFEWLFWVLLAIPFIIIAVTWGTLPESIPTHFNAKGHADGYGGKMSIFFIPAFSVGIYFLLRLLPVIDPKKANYEAMLNIYPKVRITITVFMLAIFMLVFINVKAGAVSTGKPLAVIVFALLAVLGNYMISIKPNWFLGIRTPWTLSNETVWRKTHRVFGLAWFFSGLAGIVLTLFLPEEIALTVLMALAIGSAIGSFIYSYVIHKQLHQAK